MEVVESSKSQVVKAAKSYREKLNSMSARFQDKAQEMAGHLSNKASSAFGYGRSFIQDPSRGIMDAHKHIGNLGNHAYNSARGFLSNFGLAEDSVADEGDETTPEKSVATSVEQDRSSLYIL